MNNWPARCTRVVFVAPRVPEMSGGATYVENMSDALRTRGIEIEHISLRSGTASSRFPVFVVDPDDLARAGSALRSQPGALRKALAVPLVLRKQAARWNLRRSLRQKLRTWGDETLIVFTHVLAKRAVDESGWRPRSGNRPLLVGQHHSQFESIDIESWLRPAMMEHYGDLDALTALTREDADKFAGLLSVPCHGIGNPVATAGAHVTVAQAREPVAVALARFSAEKQLDVMIRCFVAATEAPELRHWRLEIHGEGEQRELLTKCINDLAAQHRVRLMGRTDDVPTVMGRASVNLLTSAYEGFGMTILEAAVAGVPSIAFDVSPGVRELIGDQNGLLVRAGDEAAFADTLRMALSDPHALEEKGQAARLASSRYSSEAVLSQWSTVVGECYWVRERSGIAGE